MAHPDDRSGSLPSETLEEEVKRLREWHRQRNSYLEHPAQDLSQWRAYDRMPIQIHDQAVMVLTLFKKVTGHLGDLWLYDHNDLQHAHWDIYQRAAEQFKAQLEGHDCVAFWQALLAVAEKEVAKWKEAKAQK